MLGRTGFSVLLDSLFVLSGNSHGAFLTAGFPNINPFVQIRRMMKNPTATSHKMLSQPPVSITTKPPKRIQSEDFDAMCRLRYVPSAESLYFSRSVLAMSINETTVDGMNARQIAKIR